MKAQEALSKSIRDIQMRLKEHACLIECLQEKDGEAVAACLSLNCRHSILIRETLVEVIEVLEDSRKAFKSPRLEALRKKQNNRGKEKWTVNRNQRGLIIMNKRYSRLVVVMAFSMLLGTAPAFGGHPLITDDTGTQGKGKTQIELTGQYDHDDEKGVKSENWEAKAALSYGLFDSLDLVFEAPYSWTSTKDAEGTIRNDGPADLSVAVKWRFFEREGLSFALKPSVTLPTGDEDKGLGSGRSSYGITTIATYSKDPWAFHLNLGIAHNDYKLQADEDANRRDIWNASFATEFQVAKGVRLVANVGTERNSDVESDTHPAFALGGIIFSLSESIDIDAGIKWGLNGPEPDISLLAGLAFRF